MKEINTHAFCPVCNHQLTGQFNYQDQTRTLLKKRSTYTEKRIRNLFTAIQRHNKDEINAWSTYRFLKRLVPIRDNVIKKIINEFILGDYPKRMYGLSYVIGWIERVEKTRDKIIKIERMLYGGSPPVRVIEEEWTETVVPICSASPALDKLKKQQGLF